jgi:hypothetical protein
MFAEATDNTSDRAFVFGRRGQKKASDAFHNTKTRVTCELAR